MDPASINAVGVETLSALIGGWAMVAAYAALKMRRSAKSTRTGGMMEHSFSRLLLKPAYLFRLW
jgi:hypothetical protein